LHPLPIRISQDQVKTRNVPHQCWAGGQQEWLRIKFSDKVALNVSLSLKLANLAGSRMNVRDDPKGDLVVHSNPCGAEPALQLLASYCRTPFKTIFRHFMQTASRLVGTSRIIRKSQPYVCAMLSTEGFQAEDVHSSISSEHATEVKDSQYVLLFLAF
jgi:hypothetical protein